MSDGRRTRLKHRGANVTADLEGEPIARLRAVGPRQLRSEDGRMLMRFDVDSHRGTAGVTVTLVKGQTVA
jgi:hypothetical protein